MIKQNGTTTPDANSGAKAGLFVSVKTFSGTDGKTIGERIVDMYHYGTRNWLQNHHWWAMHNGHCVETTVATDAEVSAYVEQAKVALADKFNGNDSTAGNDKTTATGDDEPVIEPVAAPAKVKKIAA